MNEADSPARQARLRELVDERGLKAGFVAYMDGESIAECAERLGMLRQDLSTLLSNQPGRVMPHWRRYIEGMLGLPAYSMDQILKEAEQDGR